jgi:hypothetical protein
MPKKKGKTRVYEARVVGGHVMMPADPLRLRRYMLDIDGIDQISDEMRAVSKSYGPS